MSADTMIAILATRGPEVPYRIKGERRVRRKTEYRVALIQAAECLYADWHPMPNACALDTAYAKLFFGHSQVHTDLRFAEGYAHGMLHSHGLDTVEYGVQFFDFRHVRFPRSCP